jgi:hypothetical protein
MADLTKSIAGLNSAVDVTSNAGAASQTIVCNRGDEKVIIRMSNADAATALVTFVGNGFGAPTAVEATLEQNDVKVIQLESNRVKAPSTQKITATVTDADGTAYSGTVTNVAFEVLEAFKSLVD